MARPRADSPWTAHDQLSVGEGMISSESPVRETRPLGSMSGVWKRGRVRLLRHRQTKGPETDRPSLHYRATSRLYRPWRKTSLLLSPGSERTSLDQALCHSLASARGLFSPNTMQVVVLVKGRNASYGRDTTARMRKN